MLRDGPSSRLIILAFALQQQTCAGVDEHAGRAATLFAAFVHQLLVAFEYRGELIGRSPTLRTEGKGITFLQTPRIIMMTH